MMFLLGIASIVLGVVLFLGLVGAVHIRWLSLTLRKAGKWAGFMQIVGAVVMVWLGLTLIVADIVNLIF